VCGKLGVKSPNGISKTCNCEGVGIVQYSVDGGPSMGWCNKNG